MPGHSSQGPSFQHQRQRVPGCQGQGRRRKGNWNPLKSQNIRGKTRHHLGESKVKERAKYFESSARREQQKLDASSKLLEQTRAYAAWTFEEERQILMDKAEQELLKQAGQELPSRDVLAMLHVRMMRIYQDRCSELEEQLERASLEVRADLKVALACVRARGRLLELFGRAIRRDPNVVGVAVRNDPDAMAFVDEDLLGQKDFMLRVLKEQGQALAHASRDLRADKEVVLLAVSTGGEALFFASEELKADREVVLTATKGRSSMVYVASPELKADKDFLLQASRCSRQTRDPGPFGPSTPMAVVLLELLLPDVHCYSQAATSVKEAITEEAFLKASESNLAAPGERAPVLTVTLSRDANDTGDDESYLCEARLLSGATFACRVPITSERPQPLVNDLAAILLAELPQHTEVSDAQYILIAFERAEEDSTFVSAWDWDQPLSNFL